MPVFSSYAFTGGPDKSEDQPQIGRQLAGFLKVRLHSPDALCSL